MQKTHYLQYFLSANPKCTLILSFHRYIQKILCTIVIVVKWNVESFPNPINARPPNTAIFQEGIPLSATFVVLVVNGKGGRDKVENVGGASQKASACDWVSVGPGKGMVI